LLFRQAGYRGFPFSNAVGRHARQKVYRSLEYLEVVGDRRPKFRVGVTYLQ
jgi:hypothetical protein